jgi:ubiquinone/menaquinone biosynthesis C-methylase UbiE
MNSPATRTDQSYWDSIAENYDQVFPETVIGKVQREAVWRDLDKAFQPGMRVLELNCGTGIDAVHLAQRGVRVVACDVSAGMIASAQRRVDTAGLAALVDLRVLPTEEIDSLAVEAPFDGAFSNFSGLNCVQDISCVARNLARILKPGAKILLCMVGRFSPWEMAWQLAHGKPRLAVRLFRRKPTTHVSAHGAFSVQYPSARDMTRMFAPEFRLQEWKGIGIAVPPSCLEPLARMPSGVIGGLASIDRYLSRVPILRSMGDCVLLQFEFLE